VAAEPATADAVEDALVDDPLLADDRITAVGLLFEASALVARELEHGLVDRAGLTSPWWEVLIRLGRTPGHRLRMSELAHAMASITPSGLTRLVDRMEEAGLVERQTCAEDRRGAFAALTPAGQAQLLAALPDHLADIDRVLVGVLSSRDLAALERCLRLVRDRLQAPVGEADAGH
jgi:DNA-binding MarR family transcriptional regulator